MASPKLKAMTDLPVAAGLPDARPHVLYVAWGYPPSRGAGMYRALATANGFAREGWRVTVLTATRETFERLNGTDPEAETSIHPDIKVVRIPFDPDRGEGDLAKWSRLRIFSPLLWNGLRWLRALAGFPEVAYGSWRRPLAAAAQSIHEADPVSLVVGTANPNVDFVPGDHLYRRFGVPYVMDHRDAWHLNVYTGKRVGSRRSRSNRLERRMLDHAIEAWFVNAPIRDWHAQNHPERANRFHVVANGFDPAFLDRSKIEKRTRPADLTVGYLGTIYGPIPLRETLEGWRLARQRSSVLASASLVFRGRLGHFAEPDPEAAALLDEFRDDRVIYAGPVSKTQVSAVYSEFDLLLLIISRSRYVTSGKVFEYAATGLPIAALHDPISAATSVLDGYPSLFAADEVSAEAFAHAIVAASEFAATMTNHEILAAQEWAQHLARDEQLLPRITALSELIGNGVGA